MTETQITFADINVGDKIRSVTPCGTERVGVVRRAYHDLVVDADDNVLAYDTWTTYRIAPAFTPLPIPNEGQWIRATLRGGKVVEGAVESLLDHTNKSIPSFRAWIVGIGGHAYCINTDARTMKASTDIIAWEPIDPPASTEPDVTEDAPEQWAWIDDGHTEARKGWLVVRDGGPQGMSNDWGIFHKDLGMDGAWCHVVFHKDGSNLDEIETSLSGMFLAHIESFLAWAGKTPVEPDWFGYVGYVGYVTTPEGDVWDVMRDGDGDCAAIRRSDGRYKTLPRPAILALGTFTAVKP